MKPQKVLQINYFSKNTWGYPIWNAINEAEKCNKKYILPKEFRHNILGNLMLAISYRIDFFPLIIYRINEGTKAIYGLVKKRDRSKDAYAFDINPKIINGILIDLDSFVFELRSCCELMEKLIKIISRYFKKFSVQEFLKELPEKKWIQRRWYKELKKLRIDIFHSTAPYIDVDITKEPKYDLLFCKENIRDYRKSNNFVRLSEISNIYRSFVASSLYLQKYIITKINKLK